MHIAIITGNYPSPSRPNHGTFVQQFVWAMSRQGSRCSVISPSSVFDRRYGPLGSRFSLEDAGNGAAVAVHRPRFLTMSSRRFGGLHTGRWTQRLVDLVSLRAIRSLPAAPDVVYGHFLYHSGKAAVVAATRLGVPSVVAVGEGTFWTVEPFGWKRARRHFRRASGFIAVASHVRLGLMSSLGVEPAKILLAPNGVDRTLFRRTSRTDARRQLGLPTGEFIVVFVGAFDELKGGTELVRAVDGLSDVGLVMIGHGSRQFVSDRMLFMGRVPHDSVPAWLNAADVFVLPTREEGSCNAVIEAMACGLPIVTADGPYMDDLVDRETSIRVPPTDVDAIRRAIVTLRDRTDLRQQMSDASLLRAEAFDINRRAAKVNDWIAAVARPRQDGGRE